MIGFPRWINTYQDVLNLIEAGYYSEIASFLQTLLDSRMVWKDLWRLDDGASGIESDMYRVVERVSVEDPTTIERWQQELVEDENCRLYRLGMSVEDAERLITMCKAYTN